MTLDEKIDLLDQLRYLWAAVMGSLIGGKTFPIVLVLIPKPSFFFQTSFPNLHYPSNLIPKPSLSDTRTRTGILKPLFSDIWT